MMSIRRKRRKKFAVSTRPIISLLLGLGLLSAILLSAMFTAGGRSTGGAVKESAKKEQEPSATPSGSEVLGVVKAVNTGTKEITLYDVAEEEAAVYTYTGGTNITDKYGQPISVSQIPVGAMVEALHQQNQTKLTDIQISTKAWEYVGVNNLNIDRSGRIMRIASRKYKYTDDIIIIDGLDFIPVTNLAEQDGLTVRGYEETIWSITVTRGHGTVRLKDYERFIGDFITIGYEAIRQIAENMVITVREGNFNLTVENEDYTATKNITVYRNKETAVSLGDLGPDEAKVGRVTFKISPFGADLFVDGVLTSYANPLELTYGEHDIVISLDGYTAYEGKLTVDTAGKTIRIDLPEETSDEKATVSETTVDNNDTDDTNPGDINTDHTGTDDTDTEHTSTEDTDDHTGTDTEDGVSNDDLEVDEDHLIHIQNPTGASVYLNGEFMCTSPGSFKKVIGTHVLTFIKEGYETVSYTVEVSDDGVDTYFNMPDMVKKD